MRAFSTEQCDVFLNAFGENITIDGVSIKVILETHTIVVEDTDGAVETEETYFTAKSNNNIKVNSIVIINSVNYIIYHIGNDLSGMTNYFYRRADNDQWN